MKNKLLSVLFILTSAIAAMANGHTVTISSQTNVDCMGNATGSASVSVSGGVGPFTYSWSNGATKSTAINLTAGSYTVSVTDQNDLSTASQIVLITQPALALSSGIKSQTNVSCSGSANGSATVTASGGTSFCTWLWSNGQTTGTATNLTQGAFVVTITDANGCTTSQSVTILQPPPLTINLSVTDETCGNADGTVSATALGGTPAYNYIWAPNISGSPTPTGLTAGTYTVTVQDSYGCFATAVATVGTKSGTISGVTIVDSIYKESCLGTGDGAINITISGSNPGPFTYRWNNGATTKYLTNITSGNYTFTLFDAGMNCLAGNYALTPEGSNCGTLSGNVFDDRNFNCTNDSGDNNLPKIMVVANPGNYIAFTNNQGNYVFNAMPYGTYTLAQQINNSYTFPACTVTRNATLNTGNKNVTNLNFADSLSSAPRDLMVLAYSQGIVPGFLCSVKIYLYNLTNVPASGTVCLTLPAGYGSFVYGGNPSGYSINQDTVCWTFANTLFGSHYYELFFTVPVNTPLNSIFKVCVNATVSGGDIYLNNNNYCFQRAVTGSFDPNNKSVNPMGHGPQGDITLADKTLDYHINFQNTGNGPAVNIVIKDSLSNKLDISTFEMTGSSHDYILDVMPGNVLRWKFNNIMLADSGSNEPASHGWISYRIKQKASNKIGDQIKNNAYIYFDFNSAVITNTTLNTIATPTVIEDIASSTNSIKVYPNPFTDNTLFVIQSDKLNAIYSFELLDVLGKQVRSIREITTREFQISRNGLPNGIYFYKIYSDEGVAGIGKLIIN